MPQQTLIALAVLGIGCLARPPLFGLVLGALAACPNGKCPLPEKPQRQERVIPSLFSDANGNPDYNGIMWLDPTKLLGEERAPCRQIRSSFEAGPEMR